VLPGEMVKEPEKPKSMGRPNNRDRRPRRQAPTAEAKAEETAAAPVVEEVKEEVKKEDAE
ncbi:MAG: hypothetical protein IIZ95_03690, partial [Erysipelotrichaceae bacterium]|nr:hypothetical protein [Erysipelotrichaceae bacterium]